MDNRLDDVLGRQRGGAIRGLILGLVTAIVLTVEIVAVSTTAGIPGPAPVAVVPAASAGELITQRSREVCEIVEPADDLC